MLSKESLPTYTQKEIDDINTQNNAKHCVVVIFGIVYDLYKFSSYHPGGERLIMNAAGEILDEVVTDGNHRFTETHVQKQLAKYKLGFFEKSTPSQTTESFVTHSSEQITAMVDLMHLT